MDRVFSFCCKHDIENPSLDDAYTPWGRTKRGIQQVSNLHHFRVDVFLKVIDLQLQEINSRFNEVNTELLIGMACLCPKGSFAYFDKQKLVLLAEFYPNEFPPCDLLALEFQLKNFIDDVKSDDRFYELNDLS